MGSPGKSLIRTVDPEWFFFAPRDRKYPSGHRSNRATEAGYWKATGKDRKIKLKSLLGSTLIGMKKTLVFYLGRAPKGKRTGWIMHEYRTVDNEVVDASGDQGAYVLCHLFKKPLERTPNPNYDELDEGGLPSAPTETIHEETLHVADQENEFDTEINQDVLEQGMQENQYWLPDTVEVESEKLKDGVALFNTYKEFYGSQLLEPIDTLGCALVDSPRINCDFLFNKDNESNYYHDMGLFPEDAADQDFMTKLLDSMLCDPDEYHSKGSNIKKDSIAESYHTNQNDGAEPISLWDLSCDENYGSSNSMTSGSGPFQEHAYIETKFSPWPFSSACSRDLLQMNSEIQSNGTKTDDYDAASEASGPSQGSFDNNTGLSYKNTLENGDSTTGIKIRFSQPHPSASIACERGTATQRIHLHCNYSVGCSMTTKSSSTRDVNMAKLLDDFDRVEKVFPVDTGDLKISHNDEICSREKSESVDIMKESKSELRRRKPNYPVNTITMPQGRGSSFAPLYLVVGAVILFLLIMIFCLAKYLKY